MNLDNLEKDSNKLGFSDILKNLAKKIDGMYLSSDEYGTSSRVKSLLKEWYIKGYLQALDDYKRLAK